jgi:hypothetical protein
VAQNPDSPKAQLKAILENQLEESLRDADYKGCMIANATAEMALLDEDICNFVTNNKCTVEAFFEMLIQKGQTQGEFRENLSPAYGAAFLTNFLNGMRIVSKTKPEAQKNAGEFGFGVGGFGINPSPLILKEREFWIVRCHPFHRNDVRDPKDRKGPYAMTRYWAKIRCRGGKSGFFRCTAGNPIRFDFSGQNWCPSDSHSLSCGKP